jgi:hypothetical protein
MMAACPISHVAKDSPAAAGAYLISLQDTWLTAAERVSDSRSMLPASLTTCHSYVRKAECRFLRVTPAAYIKLHLYTTSFVKSLLCVRMKY